MRTESRPPIAEESVELDPERRERTELAMKQRTYLKQNTQR